LAIATKLKGARPKKLPRFIEPSLATLTDKLPNGAQWIHEIKFDGYRLQLRRQENDVRFFWHGAITTGLLASKNCFTAGALSNFRFIGRHLLQCQSKQLLPDTSKLC
jgi:hypothetical protein